MVHNIDDDDFIYKRSRWTTSIAFQTWSGFFFFVFLWKTVYATNSCYEKKEHLAVHNVWL